MEIKNLENLIKYKNSKLSEHHFTNEELVQLSLSAINDNHIIALIDLIALEILFKPQAPSPLYIFKRVINESIFEVSEWLEALYLLKHELNSNNQRTIFTKMLGFIQCCEQSPEEEDNIEMKYKLSDLVLEMIKKFGYND